MSEKTKPELTQWDRAGGHYTYSEYEMRQAIEPLKKRIAELEAQLSSGQSPVAKIETMDVGGGVVGWLAHQGEPIKIGAYLFAHPARIASVQEPVKVEQIAELVRNHLTSVYACTRVSSAWQVGTMTEDDFIPAREIELADEIAEAVFALLPAPAQQPLSKSDAVDAARYRYCLQHGWPECRRQIHPTVEALHWGYEDGSQYPSPTAAIDAAAMLASKDGSGMWSLGEIDGCWREIDFWSKKANASHSGVLKIVWQFEGEGESNYCQTFAASVVDLLNRTAPAQHPLRRDEVADLYEETEPLCSLYTFRDIVADVEAKHGIKEKKKEKP